MLATKSNSYTFQKSSVWYFSRRVPADLRRHYKTGRIAYSLRTKSIRDARVRAMSDAAKLDRHWHILRISSDDLPGKHGSLFAYQCQNCPCSADDDHFKMRFRNCWPDQHIHRRSGRRDTACALRRERSCHLSSRRHLSGRLR